jgi:hypothetical protein
MGEQRGGETGLGKKEPCGDGMRLFPTRSRETPGELDKVRNGDGPTEEKMPSTRDPSAARDKCSLPEMLGEGAISILCGMLNTGKNSRK